ncbi:hypothetical protein RDI61_15910 [Pseudomonas plecoglossicida]|uniref:hypothetical protein n=1 Tax=Pseudomonas putida group TaxID=136845 RepID=UPI00240FBC05|nr:MULTISPECIES: hypothetical protein [Pseudomonas putida group]MDQ7965520.1 hypothetical protein [Pseudomonas plecoglossicida]WFG03765.1 hypothetical protein P3X84_03805 [Pseudomonas putida]
MPAPDNLTVQTPGEPIVQPTTQQQTTTSIEQQPEPEYIGKHNGGGRYRIFRTPAGAEHGDWFSDFVATGDGAKDSAQAEADRLNAGGDPYFKPEETQQAAAQTAAAQPTTQQQAAQPGRAVLTDEGWLVNELPASKE